MKIETKLEFMEYRYGSERDAAAAVGVSWDAWRRWKLGERKVSVPLERLIDRLLDEKRAEGTP